MTPFHRLVAQALQGGQVSGLAVGLGLIGPGSRGLELRNRSFDDRIGRPGHGDAHANCLVFPSILHDNVIHTTKGESTMAANQLVQARIDGAVKEEAAAVLAAIGLTVSDAVRLLLTKVAQEKALPFAPLIPNATTIEAMKEARKGGLPQFDSVQALMDDLQAQD